MTQRNVTGQTFGCYGCGHWPVRFGGVVSPEIREPFTSDLLAPRTATWWTDCPKCGRVEVDES